MKHSRFYKVSLTILIIFSLSSCGESIPKEQELAIEYLKSNLLDPNTYELILAETKQAYRMSDDLKREIRGLNNSLEDYNKLERIKEDVQNLKTIGSFHSSTIYEAVIDDVKKLSDMEQALIKYGKNNSLSATLLKQLKSHPQVLQNLYLYDPVYYRNRQKALRDSIDVLEKTSEQNNVLYHEVYLRYYAVNRLGTRGINEHTYKVYSDYGMEVKGVSERVEEVE